MRKLFLSKRKSIGRERREKAEALGREALLSLSSSYRTVLSYMNIRTEFSTIELNRSLALEGKLTLPKVVGEELAPYYVKELEGDLESSPWKILEPIEKRCSPCRLEELEVVIVPAVAFDQERYRVGYGRGFYDRLIEKLPKGCRTVGVGFKEQLSSERVEIDPHDQQLDQVLLF